MLAAPLAAAAGCSPRSKLPPQGTIVGAAHEVGHRLRSPKLLAASNAQDAPQQVEVAIVGGGVAGLSAAWRLSAAGVDDFVLLELEPEIGGTARSGTLQGMPHPWGAHYLPAPPRGNAALVKLLDELGAVEGTTADGEPIYAEEMLCRDPQERLFVGGQWHEGIFPAEIATSDDYLQLARFRREIDRWVAWRDEEERRAFTIPVAHCSTAPEVAALDRQSIAEWLDERRFTSPVLRWWIEYACRDDYGLTLAQTSAWAGLFYFAARMRSPGDESEPLLTWPAGNGFLVAHLAAGARRQMRTGHMVGRIEPQDEAVELITFPSDGAPQRMQAQRVIFAAPHFLAPFVIADWPEERRRNTASFQYGAWLVANLLLQSRPQNSGFAPAWDNVLYDSPSLGYVSATHQRGRDHGPTVWTYYLPLCDDDPRAARERLLAHDWSAWAEQILTDLEQAHPDLRPLVERLDVMRWGHAMIQPRVGFVQSAARRDEALPLGRVHFAHSDLSGVALFEEAFYHGVRAAEEVLTALGKRSPSLLGGG